MVQDELTALDVIVVLHHQRDHYMTDEGRFRERGSMAKTELHITAIDSRDSERFSELGACAQDSKGTEQLRNSLSFSCW